MLSIKKLTTAIATGAVFLGAVSGASASSITISGNGAFSDNTVDYSSEHSVRVVQSNSSNITNDVSVSNNTGGNSSSFNTGGDTTIRTGNASSEVTIVNEGNSNVAAISDCGCQEGGSISIHGNGAYSENEVSVDKSHEAVYVQSNDTDVNNNVDVNNSTGASYGGHQAGSLYNPHYNNDWDHDKYMKDWWNKYYEDRKESSKKFGDLHDYFKKYFDQHSKSNVGYNFGNHGYQNGNFGHFGGNTGGDTHIQTGNAHSEVTIHNEGSSNILH